MPFLAALVMSAVIHVGVLLAPGVDFAEWDDDVPEARPLEAALVKSSDLNATHSRPPIPASKPKLRAASPKASTESPELPNAPAVAAADAVAVSENAVAAPMDQSSAVPPTPTFERTADQASTLPVVMTTLPAEGSMDYQVTRGDDGFLIGLMHHEWRHDGVHYSLRSVVETVGIAALFKSVKVVQISHGEMTPHGLKPDEFQLDRGKGSEGARFDWAAGTVTNGQRIDPLPQGTQDMLSIYYQLALVQPKSGSLDMPIATGRKLEHYHFEVLGEKVLATSEGDQQTVHLKVKTGSDTMELWLAPQLGPLPLRIRIVNKNGDVYDQRAKLGANPASH